MTWRRHDLRDIKLDVSIVPMIEPVLGGFRASVCSDCLLICEGQTLPTRHVSRIIRETSRSYHLAISASLTPGPAATLCGRFFRISEPREEG